MGKLIIVASLLAVLLLVEAKTAKEWRSRTIYQIVVDRFSQGGQSGPNCNLSKYCGGTWRGIQNNLDYIQGMGFNAIWISPVVQNTPDGYHGYWAKDFFSVNEHFGSESDLKSLVNACHSRGMWVMVGIVLNHVGPVDLDFKQITTFNDPSYYHPKCQVTDYNNQTNVELCRLANLPDLDQNVPFVFNKLMDSVTWLVNNFNIDGFRIDTIPFINKEFWKAFMQTTIQPKLNNIYLVGEVLDGRIDYVSGYANIIGATLDYPLYFAIRNVFATKSADMYSLRTTLNAEARAFRDVGSLGVFVDNHDNVRFLNVNHDLSLYQNALTFGIFARGIPIVYYGSEQAYDGGADPLNRKPLWNNFNTNSQLYQFIKKMLTFKNQHLDEITNSPHVERYVANNLYAFSRGNAFIATTNVGSGYDRLEYTITFHPYKDGTVLCDVFYPSDCITVTNKSFEIVLLHGESKIFYPK